MSTEQSCRRLQRPQKGFRYRSASATDDDDNKDRLIDALLDHNSDDLNAWQYAFVADPLVRTHRQASNLLS